MYSIDIERQGFNNSRLAYTEPNSLYSPSYVSKNGQSYEDYMKGTKSLFDSAIDADIALYDPIHSGADIDFAMQKTLWHNDKISPFFI